MKWVSSTVICFIMIGASVALVANGADAIEEATHGHSRVITPEYFGIHFHRLVLMPHEQGIYNRTIWPDQRFGSVRFWDSNLRWGDLSPSPGQWNFQRFDRFVYEASSKDSKILYTLGSTPRWASSRPDERCSYGFGCAAEPIRLAHWEEYVRRVATRYRGRIEAYELWNEPYFSDFSVDRVQPVAFFSGSVSDMVEMARLARQVLDRIEPKALLTTPGFLGGGQRHLDLFLGRGGKHYTQVISYHFYSGNAREFAEKVLDVRSIMRRHGVESLPLWNTESGVEVWPEWASLPPGVKERLNRYEAGARMAQFLILGAACGLDRFYYYSWDSEYSGMIGKRGDQLPSYEAMKRVQEWLIDSRLSGCKTEATDVITCSGALGNNKFLIVWSDKMGNKILNLPASTTIIDIEPLYSHEAVPKYETKGGQVKVRLGMAPILIRLAEQ